MSRSVASPNRVKRAVVRRSSGLRARWLRVFALFVMLFGLVAQQRVLAPVVRPSASVARPVAVRAQSIETHAVRAEPSLRVAHAPVFARMPGFIEPLLTWPRSRGHFCEMVSPPAEPARVSLGHFHGQRRIPRMNSEEPPRA